MILHNWHLYVMIWTTTLENLTLLHANNKLVDQPAHPRSLISAIVLRSLDGMIT